MMRQVSSTTPPRSRPDACPGVVTLHAAADGQLARVRIPGGRLTAAQLDTLADAAADLGDGQLELTSRGNIQLRALPADAGTELATRLTVAGLLPSATHERVRNIVASPLSGRDSLGLIDVRPWISRLDQGICADPRLAELSGRFLFALDDGRGDVTGLRADITLRATEHGVALLLDGRDTGHRTGSAAPDRLQRDQAERPAGHDTGHRTGSAAPERLRRDQPEGLAAGVVDLALDAARAFLDERAAQGGTAWRVADLTDGPRRIVLRLRTNEGSFATFTPGAPPRPGPVTGPDGRTALVALVPLGRLTPAQLGVLRGRDITVTPWRGVVVPEPVGPVTAGLVTNSDSGWYGVTACAGRPGCARSKADVRAAATAVHAPATHVEGALPVHWIGCERACGRPATAHVEVLATGQGYLVTLAGAAAGVPGATPEASITKLADAIERMR
jgi:precorrin-3B synthase